MSNASPYGRPEPTGAQRDETPPVDSGAVLAMLGDEYARAILKAISAGPLPAREIAERLDLSRATVYRRLNRLESAGVVEASVSYHPDGYHRKQFATDVDRLVLSIDADRIDVDRPA